MIQLIPRDGSTVDLQPLFARLALDSSTEFLFGDSVLSLSPNQISNDAQAFLEAYNYGKMLLEPGCIYRNGTSLPGMNGSKILAS